ncbi:MAG: phytase [Hyphomicrobiaceae bacterium]|nr:phytase [Hyphomicrobiaceae bacterium]
MLFQFVRPTSAKQVVALFIMLAASPARGSELPLLTVPSSVETEAVASAEDAADDAEIWRDASAPAKSLVIATDKKSGLVVYDLSGKLLQSLAVGRLNNVDLRANWPSASGDGKSPSVLIAASDRTRLGVSFFALDPVTRIVTHLDRAFLAADVSEPYGLCLYRSRRDASLYAVVVSKDGEVRQFALAAGPDGAVAGTLVRTFAVGSIAEGCVADDRTGALFIAEENRGIWRYGAEPTSGDARTLVAEVDNRLLMADVEGLTLHPEGDAGGHLIASSQGNSTFVVFSLPSLVPAGRFHVGVNAEAGIDEVTGTDGVAAAAGNFGPAFPDGLLVVQDDENPGSAQNFKLVSWALVRRQLGLN